MKKKEQNWMKLQDFCKRYKFVTRTGASKAFYNDDKPYLSSMKLTKKGWYIDVNRFIKEMYWKYPEIDGISKNLFPKRGEHSSVAKKIQKYLAKNPKSPIFASLNIHKKKSQNITKNCKNIPSKKTQKIARKTLKKLPLKDHPLRRYLLLDIAIYYLLDEFCDKSSAEFEKIWLETIEEYLMYLLEEINRKSA